VPFIELDQDDDHYYVVMELVKGGELFDQIIERGGFPSKDAAVVVAQILKALEYMHGEKMAHRDIKPENILFKDTNYEILKIADFGESKRFGESNLTTYCGTPDYMAPEIIKGQPYGPAVDMWAMGVIAYVVLVGFPPFDGENDVEVFASIMGVRYDFPSPEWDDIDEDAKNFISSILKENPAERLTASQALHHKWITKNVPEKYRMNTKAEASPLLSSRTEKIDKPEDENSQSGEADKHPLEKRPSTDKDKDKRKDSAKHTIKVSVTAPTDGEITEMGHLDYSDPMVSQRVLDVIAQTQNLARTSLVYMGELVTMEAIVRAIMGDKLEQLILPFYWKRLSDIRKVIASDANKKKKKK
jgi:calcium/calmodulin-dependent protein kinase I